MDIDGLWILQNFDLKKTVYQKKNCIENYYCFINNIILDRQIYLVTTENMHWRGENIFLNNDSDNREKETFKKNRSNKKK